MEFGSIPSSTKTVIIFPQTKLLQFSIFTIDPDVSQYPNIFVSANIFELKNDKIKIFGRLQKLSDIQNLAVKNWPLNTLDHIKKGGHYVFFNSGTDESSFLTTNNFVGFSDAAYSNGQTAKILTSGSCPPNQSGLTTGSMYHAVFNGISTTADSVLGDIVIGRAMGPNTLIIT